MKIPMETYTFATVARITGTNQNTLRKRIDMNIVRPTGSGRPSQGRELIFLFADLAMAHLAQALSDQGVPVATQQAVSDLYYSSTYVEKRNILVIVDNQPSFQTRAEAKRLLDRGVSCLVADLHRNELKLRAAIEDCKDAIAAAPSN